MVDNQVKLLLSSFRNQRRNPQLLQCHHPSLRVWGTITIRNQALLLVWTVWRGSWFVLAPRPWRWRVWGPWSWWAPASWRRSALLNPSSHLHWGARTTSDWTAAPDWATAPTVAATTTGATWYRRPGSSAPVSAEKYDVVRRMHITKTSNERKNRLGLAHITSKLCIVWNPILEEIHNYTKQKHRWKI